ncbi:hypothetical protein [Sporichthya polymorpha]|uniref:hypothetical protein n=1 Tax=Sporichthya polymorpha TaxID=35751 RepID=UPI00036DED51|nr:hypothetical protein [Sporichthya polymorpha]
MSVSPARSSAARIRTTGSPTDATIGGRPTHRRRTLLPAQLRPRRRQQQLDPATVIARQRRVFGGVKIGAAFFGWVTAVGMTVLLTLGVLTLMIAIGVVLGTDPDSATDGAASNAVAVSILGAILLAVVLFGAFLCGGYVAARMARFDGLLQGVAVCGWTVGVPVALFLLALVLDLGFRDVALSLLPSIATAVLGLGALGVAALGAITGGLIGERYHRVVDQVGLTGGPTEGAGAEERA